MRMRVWDVVANLAGIVLGVLLGLSSCSPPAGMLGWWCLAAFGVMVAASLLPGLGRDGVDLNDDEIL